MASESVKSPEPSSVPGLGEGARHEGEPERLAFGPMGRNRLGGAHCWLDAGEFYISYADTSGQGLLAGDGDGIETALCRDDNFFILNGDFREGYAEIAHLGWDACWEFYKKHNDISSWSDDNTEADGAAP